MWNENMKVFTIIFISFKTFPPLFCSRCPNTTQNMRSVLTESNFVLLHIGFEKILICDYFKKIGFYFEYWSINDCACGSPNSFAF